MHAFLCFEMHKIHYYPINYEEILFYNCQLLVLVKAQMLLFKWLFLYILVDYQLSRTGAICKQAFGALSLLLRLMKLFTTKFDMNYLLSHYNL